MILPSLFAVAQTQIQIEILLLTAPDWSGGSQTAAPHQVKESYGGICFFFFLVKESYDEQNVYILF